MYISCSFLIKIFYIIYIIIEAKKSIKNIKLANKVIIVIILILLDEKKVHIPKIKYIIATNKYITIFNSFIFYYSFQFTIDFSITLYIVYHIECIFRVVFK